MSESLLPCVEIEPERPATAAVVCLHGLGADGHDLAGLVPELDLDRVAPVRWVLPHAPSIPVTLNGGMRMPAWYDIRELTHDRKDHDLEGIRSTRRRIDALVRREIARGIPAARIFLAGFSQGGAMALSAGLRFPERLAGIAGLSTYLLFDADLEKERAAANAGVPVFQAHGTWDPMVPFAAGEKTRDLLGRLGHPVTWKSYPMPHAICPEEIEDLAAWFAPLLRAAAS